MAEYEAAVTRESSLHLAKYQYKTHQQVLLVEKVCVVLYLIDVVIDDVDSTGSTDCLAFGKPSRDLSTWYLH